MIDLADDDEEEVQCLSPSPPPKPVIAVIDEEEDVDPSQEEIWVSTNLAPDLVESLSSPSLTRRPSSLVSLPPGVTCTRVRSGREPLADSLRIESVTSLSTGEQVQCADAVPSPLGADPSATMIPDVQTEPSPAKKKRGISSFTTEEVVILESVEIKPASSPTSSLGQEGDVSHAAKATWPVTPPLQPSDVMPEPGKANSSRGEVRSLPGTPAKTRPAASLDDLPIRGGDRGTPAKVSRRSAPWLSSPEPPSEVTVKKKSGCPTRPDLALQRFRLRELWRSERRRNDLVGKPEKREEEGSVLPVEQDLAGLDEAPVVRAEEGADSKEGCDVS